MKLLNNCSLVVRENKSDKYMGLILIPQNSNAQSKKCIVLQPSNIKTKSGKVLNPSVQAGDRVLVHQSDQGVINNLKAWDDLTFEISNRTIEDKDWLDKRLPEGCNTSKSVIQADGERCTVIVTVKKGTSIQVLFDDDLKLVIPIDLDVSD